MNGSDEAAANPIGAIQTEPRQRSTISFPYMDLASAIAMADGIFKNVGNGECDDDQLAAWTNQSSKSSTFRVQVYASRTFGVITGESSRHKLTELGSAIVDQQRTREAKVRAFLTVPLYLAIFEKFKGGQLPPAAALEREIVNLGVAPKQKDRARQVFERSADQAGFFAHGRDRLIRPGTPQGEATPPPAPPPPPSGGGSSGGGNNSGGRGTTGDLLLDALIAKLPSPGQPWAASERVTWLSMMSMGFQMAYGSDGNIEIKLTHG